MRSKKHNDKIDDLKSARARDFDAQFIGQQKDAHDEGLKLHRDFAKEGDSADLKALAMDVVPKVEMHVSMLNKLEAAHRTRVSPKENRR